MAARVVDGLFVGDALSSMDVNFIVANKIARVINCAALELENRWEALGIDYLSFEWVAGDDFDLLAADGTSRVWASDELAAAHEVPGCPCAWLGKTCAFIAEALEEGVGVLVHSQDGTNRACSCVLAYVMNVYGWSLHKSMSFLQCKRSDLLPSKHYAAQLQIVSDWLEATYRDAVPHSQDWVVRKFRSWDIADMDLGAISTRPDEEILLHNTYLNSELCEPAQPHVLGAQTRHATNLDTPALADGSASSASAFRGVDARPVPKRRSVTWIDADEVIKRGLPVMRSPFSKRAIPERPPGPSYGALVATGRWTEADALLDHNRSPARSQQPQQMQLANLSPPSGKSRDQVSPETGAFSSDSLLSVHGEDHDDECNVGPDSPSRTLASPRAGHTMQFTLDHLDLDHLRLSLLEKGVVEGGTSHAARPPGPAGSPLRRPKRAPKTRSKPSASLAKHTRASASRARESNRKPAAKTTSSKSATPKPAAHPKIPKARERPVAASARYPKHTALASSKSLSSSTRSASSSTGRGIRRSDLTGNENLRLSSGPAIAKSCPPRKKSKPLSSSRRRPRPHQASSADASIVRPLAGFEEDLAPDDHRASVAHN